MIVRLMGEGQFRVDDGLVVQLNELDDRAQAAADEGDEPELDRLLDVMWLQVQAGGERLDDDDLHPSDIVIPPIEPVSIVNSVSATVAPSPVFRGSASVRCERVTLASRGRSRTTIRSV